MTSTNDAEPPSEEALQPFSGRVLLGLCFESGHSLWLYDFESTPTNLGGYREFWVVKPDDTRILYYDTEGAANEITRFHNWDQAVLAEMTWEWTADRIDITVHENDGTSINLEATIGDSAMSRVLEFTQRYLPGPLHRRMWGRHTETGTFGHLKSRRVRVITEATAQINNTSLGAIQSPDQPVTFGEISAFDHPFVFVGDLLLEYPVD